MSETVEIPDEWWVTTGPFTDPHCKKIAGPFPSREAAIDIRVRIEEYTDPVTFWVDNPATAEQRRSNLTR